MQALIVGVDSGIGKALAHALREMKWQVSGTSRHPDDRPGVHYLDLETLEGLGDLPECNHLFLCGAVTKFSICREDPVRARRINVDAPVEIVQKFSSKGAHAVFLSTSAVFDGSSPRQKAENVPMPTSEYGQLKADAERILLSMFPEIAVLRLTKVLAPGAILFSNWMAALGEKKEIKAFYDLSMAPITLDDAVESLIAVASQSQNGLFQNSASVDITYFDAALHIAQRLGIDQSLVIGTSSEEVGIPWGERPRYTSLDSSRLEGLMGRIAKHPYRAIDRIFGFS